MTGRCLRGVPNRRHVGNDGEHWPDGQLDLPHGVVKLDDRLGLQLLDAIGRTALPQFRNLAGQAQTVELGECDVQFRNHLIYAVRHRRRLHILRGQACNRSRRIRATNVAKASPAFDPHPPPRTTGRGASRSELRTGGPISSRKPQLVTQMPDPDLSAIQNCAQIR
jgi:hypothetical protein